MKLTAKLLGSINRPFDKDPDRFVGLRINYAGGLAWSVVEGILTITVTGGPGASVTYDLSAFTLESLVAAIAARTGYEVTLLDASRRKRSALCLLDGASDLSQPNGGALLAYNSLLWAFFEALAAELRGLRDQAANAVLQLSTTTASGAWLDEIGSYYGVLRTAGESDSIYSLRIIAQTLRPVSNNVAIENAIKNFTGQPCTVDDVVIYRGVSPLYDGTYTHNGAINYNTVGFPNYGLFDVTIAYDLVLGGDISTFAATVRAIVLKLRAGGTFLRALALVAAGSPMTDALTAPTDATSALAVSGALADTLTAPTDATSALAMQVAGFADTLAAPFDSAAGSVFSGLTTDASVAILTQGGQPIQAQIGALFDPEGMPPLGAGLAYLTDIYGAFLLDAFGAYLIGPAT